MSIKWFGRYPGDGGCLRSCERKSRSVARGWAAGIGLLVGFGNGGAWADVVTVTPPNIPAQVVPTFPELGAPAFSVAPGTAGSGVGGGAGTPGGGTGAGGGGATTLPANASLDQVAQQDYIQAAATAAGVSPQALAATCMAESNCQNVGASAGSSASGEFQMINSTYQQMINEFAANNPNIPVDTSLAGKMDPTNEAYAAAQYLSDGVTSLQAAGDVNPTNVDLRGYYQFGAGLGANIATNPSPTTTTLESIVNLTPAQMAANGITSTTTISQWQQTYANKVGAVAYQAAGA